MPSRLLLVSSLAIAQSQQQQPVLCPSADTGAIIGLASDGHYNVRLPLDGGGSGGNPERWTVINEVAGEGPQNSFTGSYMQVLPDDSDDYNDIYGPGSFTMTGLDFAFDVTTEGLYTLWLRWTAGDTVGGGDSLYAVVRKDGTDEIMFQQRAPTRGLAACCLRSSIDTRVCC